MTRGYRNIQMYEKEIVELKSQGYIKREIGEKLGFTFEQIHNFITRYKAKQRKLEAGVALHKKGRPPKNCEIKETDKINELK